MIDDHRDEGGEEAYCKKKLKGFKRGNGRGPRCQRNCQFNRRNSIGVESPASLGFVKIKKKKPTIRRRWNKI